MILALTEQRGQAMENRSSGSLRLKIAAAVVALGGLGAGGAAVAQGRGGGGGGGGTVIFLARRPPRDLVGNIRAWCNSNRAPHYDEDTTTHSWRINFMVFLPRPPGVRDVTLSWYRIERNRTERYLRNEQVGLSNPNEPIFFQSTVLTRQSGDIDPMERYVARISYSDARGEHMLARGEIQLRGQVEHRDGVVDFTGAQPQVH